MAGEAAVALPAVGVEDPELRPSPRRPEPVAGDGHLGLLAHHVAPEPDPGASRQLQAEAGRFGDGRGETSGQAGRFERHEQRLRPAGQGDEAAKPVGDLRMGRAGIRMWRQIEDEEIDRPSREERARDRQPFVERRRGEDDEPVQANAAGDGFDRIERPGHVEPGDDRALRLGLCREPERERGLSGARLTAERDAGAARQATRTQNRVKIAEAGPDDPLAGLRRRGDGALVRQRRRRQRADDPRSCRAPACLEGRQSSRHVRGERRHGQTIEQMF